MKNRILLVTHLGLALLCGLTSLAAVSGQEQLSDQREDYVSDASYWLATFEPTETQHTPAEMAAAAEALVALLDPQQQGRLLHPLDSDERREWTNLPSFNDPAGLRLGDLNQPQMQAACQLMSTLLSGQGYRKMRDIMLADDQLLDRGRAGTDLALSVFTWCCLGSHLPRIPGPFNWMVTISA